MRLIIGGSRGEARRWSEQSGHPGPDIILSSDQKSSIRKIRELHYLTLIGSDTEVCFIGAWDYGKVIQTMIDILRTYGWAGAVPPSPKAAAEKAEDLRVFLAAQEDTVALRDELVVDRTAVPGT